MTAVLAAVLDFAFHVVLGVVFAVLLFREIHMVPFTRSVAARACLWSVAFGGNLLMLLLDFKYGFNEYG